METRKVSDEQQEKDGMDRNTTVPTDDELEARLNAFLEDSDPCPLERPEVREMLLRRAADRRGDNK